MKISHILLFFVFIFLFINFGRPINIKTVEKNFQAAAIMVGLGEYQANTNNNRVEFKLKLFKN